MTRLFKSLTLSLAGAALFTACSRPMATFQASKPVHYYTQQASTTLPASDEQATNGLAESRVEQPVATAAPATAEQAGIALASLNATAMNTDKQVARQLDRATKQLADSHTAPVAAKAQKTTLVQRIVLKKMASKMQRQLAPNHPKAITGTARLGLIIAAAGLLLLLIGNGFGSILGLIALLAGGALFVYSLLQE